MDIIYYENKKAQFKNLFSIDADDNVAEFLQFVTAEINRGMLDELSNLKGSIITLSGSIDNNTDNQG